MDYAKGASGRIFLKNKLRSLGNSIKLKGHRTYIIPTGFGIAFGAISFVLLIMAIGYANNLLYFFVFLLISMALTGMMQTNKNVDLFQITAIGSEDLFVGEENQLCLTVKNKDPKLILWGIEVQFADKLQNAEKITLEEVKYERQQFMAWNPARRGKQALPRLLIESRFPFKMLRAWKYYDQNMTVLIYPRRKGIERVPVVDGKPDDQEKNARAHDEGLFRDFREFQKSDPPQRIDWKRSLKHQKHLVKNFEASGEKRVLLDWDMTAFIPEFEDRISQLVFWIELCKKKNELFALKLKDDQTEYAGTETHRKACLEKLALLQIEDVA